MDRAHKTSLTPPHFKVSGAGFALDALNDFLYENFTLRGRHLCF